MTEPYLKFLASKLDQFARDETRRMIINLPPGIENTNRIGVSLGVAAGSRCFAQNHYCHSRGALVENDRP